MNTRWPALAAALLCCQLASAQTADPQMPPLETANDASLPQVDVEGKRAKLHAMELQLYALEDQFFEQYNQINDVLAYKVKCGWEMRQHFRVHKCRPLFIEWGERGFASFNDIGSTGTFGYFDPNVVPLRKRGYQRHLIDLVGKNPKLLDVLKERSELAQRYKELRGELMEERAERLR